MGWFWLGLKGWFLVSSTVVIIGMIPNSSLFWMTKKTCSPILLLFSWTGRIRASMEMRAVKASMKEALFKRNKGTYPIVSERSKGPLMIYNLLLILAVNYEHIKYSM